MNAKMGVFAAAALTVLTAQANAKDAKKGKEPMVCANSCGGENGGKCSGHVQKDKITSDKACAAAKGVWITKAKLEENNKDQGAAPTTPAPAPAAK